MMQLNGRDPDADDVAALALANYGHFTTMRVERGAVRGLARHLDRLARDCRTLFDAELDDGEVRTWVRRAVERREGRGGQDGRDARDEAVIARVTVYDPHLTVARPGVPIRPQVLVTVRPAPASAPPTALRVTAVRYVRPLAQVKHTGLFDTVRLRRAAQLAGFDDVLFTEGDAVCEGATWNVGFFDGHDVVWPTGPVLAGVTADLLAGDRPGIRRGQVAVSDLPGLEAAFATNAAVGVQAIGLIDGVSFPADHPVLDELRARYAAVPPEPL